MTTLPVPVVRKRLDRVTSRKDLKYAKRIVVKAGTSTIVTESGFPSVRRIANIAEEIFALRSEGKEVVFVSSGACGIGRNVLRRQDVMVCSAFDRLHRNSRPLSAVGNNTYAAAGQANLMNLYQTVFQQLDVTLAELLLTHHDFRTDDRRENLQDALENLLGMGIVPVVNENDTVTANRNISSNDPFTDNDGLSSLVAQTINADLLILLTDVEGLYDFPPCDPRARLITTYAPENAVTFGAKSPTGRGGMNAKIAAALAAVRGGVPAVCICSGHRMGVIGELLHGKPNVGTLFVEDPAELLAMEAVTAEGRHAMENFARAAREGSRKLNMLTSSERQQVLLAVAKALDTNRQRILEANEVDLRLAKETNLAAPLLKRLELTHSKIDALVSGITAIAEADEPIGRIISARMLDDNLVLCKETASIGVLLVIFESRPDSMPQIAALALSSGNGLLLKGGREAEHSNAMLHSVILNAVTEASNGKVPPGVIGLVTTRSDVYELLKLEGYIDLVIPRGSNEMVQNIQRSTNIPVLGHADGICHVYVHSDANMETAAEILIDAKLNYPAACNAAETVLLHQAIVDNGSAKTLIAKLQAAGIKLFGGPKAIGASLVRAGAASMHTEYGDEGMTVEIVSDVDAAICHINKYSSHHTESILTTENTIANEFIRRVDSACVFQNCSTRFADGYRFGLGAEVGISTGRIHARGPVGVEGLLTQKWILRPTDSCSYATVAQFQGGERTFTHKDITASMILQHDECR
ncbi:putative pyrroline-5-carboxylate synthetase-like protein [Trypanosoma grayi]|uniref:putative pyrroline-5-carboxylate synthetase-like protein n=1 Tax=Trypanosoma grayi TaxID=71804 RepID=UPI0004F4A39B|nr:putative pyrroline-5-carboxylate synthetase-like protein [Trypanosoma grayi]KEG14576.1 putative pyrroline-5-carboxylate synthetase-like protein [Trypanosoma grayi]